MAGIVAAHETTANATANAMKLLLQHPRVWREICEDPSLIPNAVDECLRHNGSVAAWRRLATKDVQIEDIDIPAGSKLLIVMSSANHDERHFADADLFDIRRDNASDHLTFGYGSHQCMGKNLARMEMQIFLEEFTRRLPHMSLRSRRSATCPTLRSADPSTCGSSGIRRRTRSGNPALLEVQVPVRIGEPSRTPSRGRSWWQRHAGGRGHRQVAPCLARRGAAAALDAGLAHRHRMRRPGCRANTRSAAIRRTRALEIAVLREDEGRGGSAWVHANVSADDQLKIRGPRNHFRMDESLSKVILIAGGIGITPVSAMARRAKTLGMDYELHYSGRSRTTHGVPGPAGRVARRPTARLRVSDEGRRNDLQALLATPARHAGLRLRPRAHAAALEGAAPPGQRTPCGSSISCPRWDLDPRRSMHSRSNSRIPASSSVRGDQTVLAALRAANIDVQSDCEEGLCGSCEVRVLAGTDRPSRRRAHSRRAGATHDDLLLARAKRQAGARPLSDDALSQRADAAR